MAINGRLPATTETVFPYGSYGVSEVEPQRDWDRSTPERFVQQVDVHTGLPVWVLTVLDADPAAKPAEKTVQVKIMAELQPVPPPEMQGVPLRPIEFEGLTVTPYVDDKRGRVAYSIRATGMKAPAKGPRPVPVEAGKSNN